jgi:hypothetical protein
MRGDEVSDSLVDRVHDASLRRAARRSPTRRHSWSAFWSASRPVTARNGTSHLALLCGVTCLGLIYTQEVGGSSPSPPIA